MTGRKATELAQQKTIKATSSELKQKAKKLAEKYKKDLEYLKDR